MPENWKDSNGISLAPDRFRNSSMALMIAADNAGPCLGIGLNIWERAKLGIHFSFICFISIISIICIITMICNVLCRYDGISCTHWWVAEASMEGLMPLITARSSIGMLVHWVPMLSSLCCLINLRGFYLSFTLVDLKVLIYQYFPDDRSDFDVHGALGDDKVK
jgi:hypothetical protein